MSVEICRIHLPKHCIRQPIERQQTKPIVKISSHCLRIWARVNAFEWSTSSVFVKQPAMDSENTAYLDKVFENSQNDTQTVRNVFTWNKIVDWVRFFIRVSYNSYCPYLFQFLSTIVQFLAKKPAVAASDLQKVGIYEKKSLKTKFRISFLCNHIIQTTGFIRNIWKSCKVN